MQEFTLNKELRICERLESQVAKGIETVSQLLNADYLREVFDKDTLEIIRMMDTETIDRKSAKGLLSELESLAESLPQRVGQVRRTFRDLSEMIANRAGNSKNTSQAIPWDRLVEDIVNEIRRKRRGMKKEGFGVLKIEDRFDRDRDEKELREFFEDFESGVITISIEKKELHEMIGKMAGRECDVKVIREHSVFTFE